MLHLEPEIIVFDTEYTTWEGAQERRWSGPGEFKEIVQIGAVRIETETFKELDSLLLFIKPVKNPTLSEYFIGLTNISQKDVDEKGITYPDALARFGGWIGSLRCYSFGNDMGVMKSNSELLGISFPFDQDRFHDIRDTFRAYGISTDGYMSSTIIKAFGKETDRHAHDGLSDSRTIVDALRELYKIA